MMRAEIIQADIYNIKIVAAFLTMVFGIVRPKASQRSFCRKMARDDINMIAKVVTFTPHAVDPGAPPMTIKIDMISRLFSESVVKSTVLNPAVRGVTAWKIEASNLSFIGKF